MDPGGGNGGGGGEGHGGGVGVDQGHPPWRSHQFGGAGLDHGAPGIAHRPRHGGGVEPEGLGVAAHGDDGGLLVGQTGQVALLEELEVEATDPGAVLDRLEAEAEALACLAEVGTEGEGRPAPLSSHAATAGRSVAPCDDHDGPFLPLA